jgi:glycosyltransferase involved in cell wall biosynthesis
MTAGLPRVAIVHEHFTQHGGSEWVVEQLRRIWSDAPVYTALVDASTLTVGMAGARFETSWLQGRLGGSPSRLALLPLASLAMPAMRVRDADLVVVSHHTYAQRVRVPAGAKVLSYVHTPARWMWEPERRRDEERSGLLVSAAMTALAATQRRPDRRAARRVDRLVANSLHTADRIRRWWGVEADVVHPPVDTEFFAPDAGVAREDFYLLAGRLVHHKRPDVVVRAARSAGVRLVVAGEGRARPELEAAAGPGVEFRGAVTREELRHLYRRCRAAVFGGEEEFGIVAVEAQACGTPVIGPALGGIAEGALDGVTGVLYPFLGDVAALAGLLRGFDPARFDPVAIRRHAEGFSAASFRRRVSELASELVGGVAGRGV